MTIAPVQADLGPIYQYATYSQPIQLANPDGSLLDLTGKTFELQARQRANSPETIFTLSTDNGRIVVANVTIDGVTYNLTLQMTDVQTGALKPLEGVYDMLMTDTGSGEVDRVIYGQISVSAGVTR